ncbi:Kinesin-like protein KIF3C [Liparis tanakae]|uniref:Kinesin-like protein KIF3C n=1 Tax=Liparis tanakae TaxID=230148 RepID=A0A4Z2H0V1_9TELE|nr:Kinesin-like protein KIF3C [Liparis tanakae]
MAMESKLLVGGKNIIDHTNEQQKMLEGKRHEIAEQTRSEREIQQQMLVRDEETVELRETFTSLQQEVEAKTKKLKKVHRHLYAKLQCIKAEIQDVNDEHAENIMFLELDMTPPSSASLDRSAPSERSQSQSLDNSPTKDRGVRKSRSWCQTPKSITSSSSNVSLAACHTATPMTAQ